MINFTRDMAPYFIAEVGQNHNGSFEALLYSSILLQVQMLLNFRQETINIFFPKPTRRYIVTILWGNLR